MSRPQIARSMHRYLLDPTTSTSARHVLAALVASAALASCSDVGTVGGEDSDGAPFGPPAVLPCEPEELICGEFVGERRYCHCPTPADRDASAAGKKSDAGVPGGGSDAGSGNGSGDGGGGGGGKVDGGSGGGGGGKRDGGGGSGCIDDCVVAGQTRCSGPGANYLQTCGRFDDDPCLEWNAGRECAYGCSRGACKPQPPSCSDECSAPGQKKCIDGSIYTCGSYDQDSCLEWGAEFACTYGCTPGASTCNGQPPPPCTHECSPGQKICRGNQLLSCGYYDDDDCKEFGGAITCPYGCANAACLPKPCTDECSTGQLTCSGNNIMACGNYDADSCLEWGYASTCQHGCANGACLPPPCTNECGAAGQQACNGNTLYTCGNYDADSCLEWGHPYACNGGCSGSTCIHNMDVGFAGECVWVYCPNEAPHPIGCTIQFGGDDCRGCVANDGSNAVFFKEGNSCSKGGLAGVLRCSNIKQSGLNADNCKINRPCAYYETSYTMCPTSSGRGCYYQFPFDIEGSGGGVPELICYR